MKETYVVDGIVCELTSEEANKIACCKIPIRKV